MSLRPHGFEKRTPSLLPDAIVLVLAASARVVIERVHGAVLAESDLGEMFIPNYAWWWGRWRLLGGWNQWILGGYPANADPLVGQLHPFGLLYASLAALTAVGIEAALGPSLAAVGMLVYLRGLGCARTASLVGALSYGLSGFLAAHVPHPEKMRAAMAIPWALAAIEQLDGSRLIAGLGASTAAIFLSGHPQTIAYSMTLVTVYGAWLGRPSGKGRAIALGAAIVLGAGVTAATWIPALQLIRLSTHDLGGLDPGDPWRMNLAHLRTLFVPFAEGGSHGPLYGQLQAAYWGILETTGYPGMLVWLVVLGGVPMLLRDRHGRFWLAMTVTGILLSTGPGAELVPLRGIRAPARLLLWFNLGMAAMAGLVLRARDDPRDGRARAPVLGTIACSVAVFIAAAMIAWTSSIVPTGRRAALGSAAMLVFTAGALALARRPGGRAGYWLVGAVAADLIAFGASLPLGVTRREYERLGSDLAALRAAMENVPEARAQHGRSLMFPAVYGANWAPFAGVQIVQGYNALIPETLAMLLAEDSSSRLSWMSEEGAVTNRLLLGDSNRALDLLRCWLVVVRTTGSRRGPVARAIENRSKAGETRWKEVRIAEHDDLLAYVNQHALPVAWLVGRTRIVSRPEALALVHGTSPGGSFDPAREALVEARLPGIPGGELHGGDAGVGAARPVTVLAYDEDEIRLSAESEDDALLVTSELAYPGWSASIDGRATIVLNVNTGFRGVVVPAGRHEIVFTYRPLATRIGITITTVCLVALFYCALVARRD